MIRRMTEEDLEQVADNEAACFSRPWSLRAFAEMLTKKEAIYLVAETGGRIVAHCGVINIAGEGEITNVAVRKECRNQGIGRKMLVQLIQEGREAGILDFTLEVRAGNASAIHLYESLGFLSEGIRPGFYDSPREDALIMWKRQAE